MHIQTSAYLMVQMQILSVFSNIDNVNKQEILLPCPSTKMQLFCLQQELGRDFQHKLHTFPSTFGQLDYELCHPFSILDPASYNQHTVDVLLSYLKT